MAKGDLTKTISYDQIEVVQEWNIQIRKCTIVNEEQEDGSNKLISKTFHRHIIVPYQSTKDNDGKWTHTETDLNKSNDGESESDKVKAIALASWDNDTKTAYKTFIESQSL